MHPSTPPSSFPAPDDNASHRDPSRPLANPKPTGEGRSHPSPPSPLPIDDAALRAAVLGGAILGGGGGGWIAEGERLGLLALERGLRAITPIDSLPADALLLTVSLVGAPSAGSGGVRPEDYVRAVELFLARAGLPIAGLISSEIGAVGVVNGWLQAAALGLPVVDAPCNGRAHPIGLMGSMGLHRVDGYMSRQTAVGGGAGTGMGGRVEHFHEGPLDAAARQVLESAIEAGGMVAVARNPVTAGYVRAHGAPGAVRMAVELGEAVVRAMERGANGADAAAREALLFLGGHTLLRAAIRRRQIHTVEGLDVGALDLDTESGPHLLTFWNEYMTLDRAAGPRGAASAMIRSPQDAALAPDALPAARSKEAADPGPAAPPLARFPDLIVTFDARTALPVPSAETREGQEVIVISAPAARLLLGAGCRDPHLLRRADDAVRALRKE